MSQNTHCLLYYALAYIFEELVIGPMLRRMRAAPLSHSRLSGAPPRHFRGAPARTLL